MKRIIKWELTLLFIVLNFAVASCGGDSDEPVEQGSNLIGTWYGTRYYNNPVGGIKYQYLTVHLNQDHSGSLEYEAPTSYSAAYFKWEVKGTDVICNGAIANSDGETNSNFSLILQRGVYLDINGNDSPYLKPEGQFNVFFLTKDNSMMTDGDGKIVVDPDEQLYTLQNTWVMTDGSIVLTFYPGGTYEEYVLTSSFSKTYSDMTSGKYEFYPLQKQVRINTTYWDVLELTKTSLRIKNGSRTLSYKMGTRNDIPSAPDIKQYLLSSYFGWSDKNTKYILHFYDNNKIRYFEKSSQSSSIYLDARGTFSTSGNTVTGYFDDVSIFGVYDSKIYFPGWQNGKACTQTFNIEVTVSGSLKVTLPNGSVVYFDKL